MIAPIRCIDCKRFSFKRVPVFDARRGHGHCEQRAPFIRYAAATERDCEEFNREADDIVAARIQWLKQQQEGK